MIELQQDLWAVDADWICITTNGSIKKDGSAVMGRGCALEAKQRFTGIDANFGCMLTRFGNQVQHIWTVWNEYKTWARDIFSFPVKHNWHEKADIKLIERSCRQLVELYERSYKPRIALPRPGCGNGHLNWDVVRPVCEYYFTSDDFVVVYK